MNGYDFSKSRRLLGSRDFDYLKKDARRLSRGHVRFYYKPSRLPLGHVRLGISVSKKVGNAVVRNKIKRLCREELRTSSSRELEFDILVVFLPWQRRAELKGPIDFQKLRLEFKGLLTSFEKTARSV